MDGDQPAPGRLDEPVEAMQRTPDSLSFDEKAARRRSRNSILYEASGADKLLEVVGSRLDGPCSLACSDCEKLTGSHRSC